MIFALALAISTMSFALAEDNQSVTNDSNVSLISENPAAENATAVDFGLNESVSGGQIAWKQFKLWFTFNQEKKIEGELDLARLRLIQARVAAKNNKSEALTNALDAHEKIMDRVQQQMNKLGNSSDGSKLNASATRLVGLERAIRVHELRINFLNSTLQNANLTDAQRAKIEDKMTKAENVTAKLNDLKQAKIDKLKTKLMAVANLTDEQVNKVLDVMRQNKGEKPGKAPPRMEDKPRNNSPGQGRNGPREPRAPPRPENGLENVLPMPGNESN